MSCANQKTHTHTPLWADNAGKIKQLVLTCQVKDPSEGLLPVLLGLMSESWLDFSLHLPAGWALHGRAPCTAAGSSHAAAKWVRTSQILPLGLRFTCSG